MQLASDLITVLLEAIFALVEIGLSIIFSYLGTLGLLGLVALFMLAAVMGAMAIVRYLRGPRAGE